MGSSTAGVLMILGSTLFGVGAAVGVPRVFTQPDREQKLRMLEERLLMWRVAQPFYGVGPLVASVGVGFLAASRGANTGRTWLTLSCLLLLVGALCWSWSVYLRTIRYRDFALGGLPGWPFAAYVVLTLGGLAMLGVGLLLGTTPDWLGWLAIGADALFIAAYVRWKDIPPFVFYLLMTVVGAVVL
jgi:hypothetical protein